MQGTLVRGYPQRRERLPVDFSAVNRDWLTGVLQLKYPDLIVEETTLIEFVSGHSSKARMTLKVNSRGVSCTAIRILAILVGYRMEADCGSIGSLFAVDARGGTTVTL